MTVTVEYPDPVPNGLASMLGGLLEGNLSAHPDRERLLSSVATYGIRAPDVGVEISIRLAPGKVTVRNGIVGKPEVVVETDAETLVGLSSVPLKFGLPDIATREGREVNRKLLRRRLKVKGLFLHPGKLARLNKLLTVI
ncbi:MAG TPA: hypothetical protein VGL18_14315 [Actinomycetota bacterium]